MTAARPFDSGATEGSFPAHEGRDPGPFRCGCCRSKLPTPSAKAKHLAAEHGAVVWHDGVTWRWRRPAA